MSSNNDASIEDNKEETMTIKQDEPETIDEIIAPIKAKTKQ